MISPESSAQLDAMDTGLYLAAAASSVDLGDEDLIPDGGTEVLSRADVPAAPPKASLPPPVPPPRQASALDELSASVPVKAKPIPTPAPAPVATPAPAPKKAIPAAAETARIIEVEAELDDEHRVDATRPFVRASLPSTAPRPAAGAPVTLFGPAPAPAPTNTRHPSIAPLSVDVPVRPSPDATRKLAPVREAPKKGGGAAIVLGIVGGLALCASVAAVVVASRAPNAATTASAPAPTVAVAAKPHEAENGSIRSAIIETPETTSQKAAPPAVEEDSTPVFSASALPSAPAEGAPAPHTVAPAAAAPRAAAPAVAAAAPRPATAGRPAKAEPKAAAPAPAPEPAPAPAPKPTTGTILVPASLMTVQIDGDYARAQGGRVVVACGHHRVNAGRGTQSVDVPCGGVYNAAQ